MIPPSFGTTQVVVLLDSKMNLGWGEWVVLGVVGVCGDGAGQDLGRKGQQVGEQGPCMGSQPLEPSETNPLAQTQEFIRVSQSPRASLGHGLERAEGSGVAVKSDF